MIVGEQNNSNNDDDDDDEQTFIDRKKYAEDHDDVESQVKVRFSETIDATTDTTTAATTQTPFAKKNNKRKKNKMISEKESSHHETSNNSFQGIVAKGFQRLLRATLVILNYAIGVLLLLLGPMIFAGGIFGLVNGFIVSFMVFFIVLGIIVTVFILSAFFVGISS